MLLMQCLRHPYQLYLNELKALKSIPGFFRYSIDEVIPEDCFGPHEQPWTQKESLCSKSKQRDKYRALENDSVAYVT